LTKQLPAVSVPEVFRQNEIVPAFFQGTLSNVQEADLVIAASFLETLGDVRGNGNCRSPDL
jgi:hypothetical protein